MAMIHAERPHSLLWTRLFIFTICVGDTNFLERKSVDRIECESESTCAGLREDAYMHTQRKEVSKERACTRGRVDVNVA